MHPHNDLIPAAMFAAPILATVILAVWAAWPVKRKAESGGNWIVSHGAGKGTFSAGDRIVLRSAGPLSSLTAADLSGSETGRMSFKVG